MNRMKNLMKTSLYAALFGLCIMVSTSGFSQEQETSNDVGLTPKFGIKGGLNLSNLYINNVEDENVKVSGHVGVFAKLPLGTGVSLMPELLYTSKGSKVTYDNALQGRGEYRFNLNYVELPLTLVFNIGEHFNLHGGAYAAYLVSANVKNLSDGTISGFTDLRADNFNRADYGLVGGLGVDIENVTIGARYNYGMAQVGKSGTFSGDMTSNGKNSNVSVFIGFAF
jgi:hypothetical protein